MSGSGATGSMLGGGPVIVAGAGPVGCICALHLALNGISVMVLEGEADLPVDLRASTFHPPTLDMLNHVGLAEPLIEIGLKVPNYQYRMRGSDLVANFDLGLLASDTGHPYRLQVEQFRLTRIARDALEALPGVDFRLAHKVTAVRQDRDCVHVDVDTTEGACTFEAPLVIGADGASSAVRTSAGITFDGFTYPEKFLFASTPYPLEQHFRDLSWVAYFSDPAEWCLLLRCNDLWRVLMPTDVEVDDAGDLSDAFFQERLRGLVPDERHFDLRHTTLYRVHQRVAATYRSGRVLLAGDAAHINNPLGGMGMNGGIHDAVNLAEKIVAIAKGEAGEEALDLYDRQRRTICTRFVQEHTMANKKNMELADPGEQLAQQRALMEIAADTNQARAFLLRTSMIESVRESYEIP